MENEFTSIKDGLTDAFTRLEELQNRKNGITGITTGFTELDYAINGLNKSNLIVIASRPSIGKSTLAFNIATNVALTENIPIAIFSLEMSKEDCINRIISSEALVEHSKLNTGKLEDDDWNKLAGTIGQLSNAELYINDTPGISVEEIREKCIKLKKEKNIGLVVIDYLQLIGCNKSYNSCEQEISTVSLALKELAQELNIPIIVLSALSKSYSLKPALGDLRYTGSLIQNADVIMLLYRDEYYYPDSIMKNEAEIEIVKNRHGSCCNVDLLFIKQYLKFVNLERHYDKEKLRESEDDLKRELDCLKKYTKILDGININDVKQLERNSWNRDIYVLLNNGDLYVSGVFKDTNVDELFMLDGDIHIYKIKKDKTIIPMREEKNWKRLDVYLCNNRQPYKKIITNKSAVVGLTMDNRVIALSFFEFLGIIPENFIDVDDVFIEEDIAYIVKAGKAIPLYVTEKTMGYLNDE